MAAWPTSARGRRNVGGTRRRRRRSECVTGNWGGLRLAAAWRTRPQGLPVARAAPMGLPQPLPAPRGHGLHPAPLHGTAGRPRCRQHVRARHHHPRSSPRDPHLAPGTPLGARPPPDWGTSHLSATIQQLRLHVLPRLQEVGGRHAPHQPEAPEVGHLVPQQVGPHGMDHLPTRRVWRHQPPAPATRGLVVRRLCPPDTATATAAPGASYGSRRRHTARAAARGPGSRPPCKQAKAISSPGPPCLQPQGMGRLHGGRHH